jgi:hypothetical protein
MVQDIGAVLNLPSREPDLFDVTDFSKEVDALVRSVVASPNRHVRPEGV